jgi:hypothetical protein
VDRRHARLGRAQREAFNEDDQLVGDLAAAAVRTPRTSQTGQAVGLVNRPPAPQRPLRDATASRERCQRHAVLHMRAEQPPPLHRLLTAELRQAAQRTPTTVLPAGFPGRADRTARLIRTNTRIPPPAIVRHRSPPISCLGTRWSRGCTGTPSIGLVALYFPGPNHLASASRRPSCSDDPAQATLSKGPNRSRSSGRSGRSPTERWSSAPASPSEHSSTSRQHPPSQAAQPAPSPSSPTANSRCWPLRPTRVHDAGPPFLLNP